MSAHNTTSLRRIADIPAQNPAAVLYRTFPLARSWGQARAVVDVPGRWWYRHLPLLPERAWLNLPQQWQGAIARGAARCLNRVISGDCRQVLSNMRFILSGN